MEIPEYLHHQVANTLANDLLTSERKTAWAVILGLTPALDGDQFCILWGENLQEGVCGFGPTPEKAIWNFEKAMSEKYGPKP